MASSILSSGFTGRTGYQYGGMAGRLLPMPGSGDGVTMWVGGSLWVGGVPPGTQAQLVDGYKVVYAEAIFGFNGLAQFFRPPMCDFPVGCMPGLNLMISYGGVTGPIRFPTQPLPLPTGDAARFPLFINSQDWMPSRYTAHSTNNNVLLVASSPSSSGFDYVLQVTRGNTRHRSILPPARRQMGARL